MTRSWRNGLGFGGVGLMGLSLAACTPAPNILPTNDLNRPTDIAFMCLGAYGDDVPGDDGGTVEGSPFKVTGRPMRTCHAPAMDDNHQDQPDLSIHNRTFAFVPNSASGDLTVIDADNWKIIDLDKSTGGYGRVPLGTLPEQISASTDGCRLVSANRGSCDLALVDPSTLLAGVFAAQYNSPTVDVTVPQANDVQANGVQRVTPHWPSADPNKPLDVVPLNAAPYEAVFLPRNIAGLTGKDNVCSQNTVPWRALVTFPSCDLVATVEFPSGEIVAALQLVKDQGDPTKMIVQTVDPKAPPSCRADCGRDRADAGTQADATSQYSPTGIAIVPTGDRAYVSLAKSPEILSLALATSASTSTISWITSVEVHADQGSNRIRLGIDPWAIQGTPAGDEEYVGAFVGQDKTGHADRNYLYVISRDGSLRIISVFDPGHEIECETNFDPLNNPPQDPKNPCIPYGSVARRPYSGDATSGLRFATGIPIDVAAAHMTGDPREETVNGGYAWVLTSSGTIYLVNINPDSRTIAAVVHQTQGELFPQVDPANPFPFSEEAFVYKTGADSSSVVHESTPFPNQPRDRNVMSYTVSLDPSLGPTRLDLPPLGLPTGPYIEPLWTQGTEDDATALDVAPRRTYVFFPDRNAAVAQGWDVTWQGTVISPRYSGILHGNVLKDGGGGFCSAGVLPGDIVTLRGCTATADCPLGLVCLRDQSLDQVPGGFTVTGLCVSANMETSLSSSCSGYVDSLRRYEIVDARENQLTLEPHVDEVVRSSASECRLVETGTGGTTGMGGTTGAAGTGGAAGTMGTAGMGGTDGMAGMGGGGAGAMAGTGGSGTMTGGTGGTATGGGGGSGTGGTAAIVRKGCVPENDCWDPTDSSTCTFECVTYKGQPRCVNRCAQTQDCRNGRLCLPTCSKDGDCPSSQHCTADGLCHARRGRQDPNDPNELDPNSCGPNKDCLPGEACVDGQCRILSVCVDGPPLQNDNCFPQLTSYHVSANASFLVTGTQAGSFSAGTTTQDGVCRPYLPTERDPRLVSRIPLRPYPGQDENAILCEQPNQPVFPTLQKDHPFDMGGAPPAGKPPDRSGNGYYIDRFDPSLEPALDTNVPGKLANVSGTFVQNMVTMTGLARPEAPQLVEWMKTWTRDVKAPNACIYLAGPIASDTVAISTDPTTRGPPPNDPTGGRPQHLRARFRNTQVAFVLADIERGPPAGNTIHFDVHGGFRQQAVVNLSTVEVSAPARLVLGPIDSTRIDTATGKAAPFFFVVDQRRLGRGQGGGPTRGQVVRVNPFGFASTNGYQPVYEDYHASNGLFPIQ